MPISKNQFVEFFKHSEASERGSREMAQVKATAFPLN